MPEDKAEVDNNASASVDKPEEEKKEETVETGSKLDEDGNPVIKRSNFYWMEKTKAYDRAGLERGFKDKEFATKEKQDLESLQLAIAFIRSQVETKK